GSDFGFTRDGDQVTFTFPGSGQGSSLGLGGQQVDPSQLPPGMAPEVRIAVTFPGPVTDADEGATTDGNTASWGTLAAVAAAEEAAATERNTASWGTLAAVAEGGYATGELDPGLFGGTGWLIWVVAGLLLAGVLVVAFVLLAQRKSRQTAVVAGEGPAGAPLA